jgi:hypothetical protein
MGDHGRRSLSLGLECVLALLEHLPRLDKLSLCASVAATLPDGDLLLQLGDSICNAAAEGSKDVLGLLCGSFL